MKSLAMFPSTLGKPMLIAFASIKPHQKSPRSSTARIWEAVDKILALCGRTDGRDGHGEKAHGLATREIFLLN